MGKVTSELKEQLAGRGSCLTGLLYGTVSRQGDNMSQQRAAREHPYHDSTERFWVLLNDKLDPSGSLGSDHMRITVSLEEGNGDSHWSILYPSKGQLSLGG